MVLGVSPSEETDLLRRRFTPLAEVLQTLLQQEVRLEISKSPLTQIIRTGIGRIDIAYLEAGEYLKVTERYGQLPILTGLAMGKRKASIDLIAIANNSRYKTISDLQGARLAISDPDSNIGAFNALRLLEQTGISVKQIQLEKQPNIAFGILAGDFDAGVLTDHSYQNYAALGLRTLRTLPASPPPVFVASKSLPVDLREKVSAILNTIGSSPEYLHVIAAIDPFASGFTQIVDQDFDEIRKTQ